MHAWVFNGWVNRRTHPGSEAAWSFDNMNQTPENASEYLYPGLAERLNRERVRGRTVTTWDNNRACVRYTED